MDGVPTSVQVSNLPVPRTGRADVHLHTDEVDGLQSVRDLLDYAETQTNLDLVAITDHDAIRGALRAQEIVAHEGLRVQVIAGTEVTTRHGHVLALFVDRAFPMLKSIDATLAAIHEAGGIAIVPHPMSWLTTSIGERNLRRIHALGDAGRDSGVYFDAVEMLNPSVAGRVACRRARDLNQTVLNLPVMAGSDAHATSMIGTAYTTFPGTTPHDLRAAFARHQTRAHGRFWTFGEHRAIASESLYRAWVLVPARKVREIAGRGQKRETRWEEARNQKPEDGSQKPEAGGQRLDAESSHLASGFRLLASFPSPNPAGGDE